MQDPVKLKVLFNTDCRGARTPRDMKECAIQISPRLAFSRAFFGIPTLGVAAKDPVPNAGLTRFFSNFEFTVQFQFRVDSICPLQA